MSVSVNTHSLYGIVCFKLCVNYMSTVVIIMLLRIISMIMVDSVGVGLLLQHAFSLINGIH